MFAESAKERDKWMQQIRSVIGRLQNKSNVNHLRHRFESQVKIKKISFEEISFEFDVIK